MNDMRDVVIIGSGPAGYTAAIYLGRAGFEPLVVAGALTPGGQLVNTTEVENFPGFPDGIMGPDLMDNMRKQAERFGTHIVWDDVVSVASNADSGIKTVTLDGGDVYDARALVIATGSNYRKLGVPGGIRRQRCLLLRHLRWFLLPQQADCGGRRRRQRFRRS